jgi:spermidine synthase
MTARRYLPALLLLFVGSGCAALIYEVVWFQLLQLTIGSSAVSLGVLLGTFMGGMCLGSILLPRRISASHHPLKVYAYLELGIGVIGVLVLYGMPLLTGIYTSIAGSGIVGILLRGVAAAICLLPPTLLMGATLPAIARWVKTTPEGVSWLGFFYGGNIAGAVLGSLTAGFYLLRVHDLAIATFAAVGLNILVAVIALVIARSAPYEPAVEETAAVVRPRGATAIYIAIGISGMTALSAEVIWTRILSLLYGGTVYTFALILAVFLFGLGIGSSVGSALSRNIERPRLALAWVQMLLAGAIAWSAYMLTQSLPYWPIDPSTSSSPWFTFQLDLVRSLWAMLPAAILWGASFPLALASVADGRRDPAKLVGGVYAANTVGAIVGSLTASLLLVVWVGSQRAQQLLIILSVMASLLALDAASSEGTEKTPARGRMRLGGTLLIVGAAMIAAWLARNVGSVPAILVAYGRYAASRIGQADVIDMREGWNASIAVTRLANGVLNYHNAGKVQASSEPQDMRLQRMLGHMTTLMPPDPKRVLVIGFGAGVTAGAVSIEPRLEQVTIAEIEPLVPVMASEHFGAHNFDVYKNPKTRLVLDDGRHFLMTTNEKFDAITSDPLDPWVKGAAALYTREFFEEVKQHLNPGGVMTLFVQLYESNPAAVKSEISTFLEAFPHGIVWGNTQNGAGYDLVLMGGLEPLKIDVDKIEQTLKSPQYARVAQSLSEIGMFSAVDLFSTYAGKRPDLEPWMADAMINRDRNLRLQYLAGLGLNLYQSEAIYADMLKYATRYPDELFTGSPATLQALKAGIARQQGR